jgi:hypothetical protein
LKNKKPNQLARSVRIAINGSLLTGCLSLGATAYAAIDIQFEYKDEPYTGFLDPAYGLNYQRALNTAASEFSSMFGSHFSNSGTITLEVSSTPSYDPIGLAGATSEYPLPKEPGFNLNEVVRTKLQTGKDLNGSAADGSVEVDLRANWEWDYNASPSASGEEYDFYSTLFHEFTHTLGFYSSMTQNGSPYYSIESGYAENQLSWTRFDSFIVDKNGNPVINSSDHTLNPVVWEGSTGGASPAEGLFFNGPNAVAANGGQPVGLYTPGEWSEGSSVSHLDDDNPAFAQMMMAAFAPPGPTERDFSPVEVGILMDLGYSATVVPEPETYAMFLAGLGMLGWITRRSRQG